MATVMDLIDAALRCDKPDGRFAYVAPTYAMAKDISFGYLKRFTTDIPGVEQRESDLSVIFPNGARVRLYGVESYDRLRGIYLDGCILDEAGDMPPQAWPEVIRPALADRQGWAVFIGTPRGRNEFHRIHEHAQLAPDWFSLTLRADQTGLLPQQELDDIRNMLTPEAYAAEMLCSFDSAILGAYFAKELDEAQAAGRITSVPYDPILPVHTAWDLGVSDSTAIWFFQVSRAEVRVIDYYEASGYGLPHYAAVLTSRGYNYGTDYLPHDAQARQLGTGRSLWETLHSLTNRIPRVLAQQNLMDGINAARISIASCWFDTYKCHDGLEALRAYRADYDDKRKVFTDRPRHDWASHGCLTGDAIVLTDHGLRRIDQMKAGDRVWTPAGYAVVEWAGVVKRAAELVRIELPDGRRLTCTPEHKIATNRGFVHADALRYLDVVLSGNEWQSYLIGLCSRVASTGYRAIITAAMSGESQDRPTFIERCGSIITALCRTAVTYIIGTATHSTMLPATLNASMPLNTSDSTHWSDAPAENSTTHLTFAASRLLSGTPAPMASNGIGNTAKRHGTRASGLLLFAASVVRALLRLIPRGRSGAISIVRWKTYASGADAQLVYDLTVKDHACYQANGLLVSNSDAFRYLGLAWRQMQPEKPPKPPEDSWDRAFARASQSTVESWRVA
jgi:hypothetical protein